MSQKQRIPIPSRFVGEAINHVTWPDPGKQSLALSVVRSTQAIWQSVRHTISLGITLALQSTATQVIEALANDLRSSQNLHKLQLLDCMRTKLLQCPDGGPSSKAVNASLSSRTTFFQDSPRNLNTHGWTNLHYAVARNDLYMLKNLLRARANVNAKTKAADKDFFLRPAMSPLHVWPLGCRSPDLPLNTWIW